MAAGGAGRSFALAMFGLLGLLGVEAALFAAADAAMGPQSFENHFRSGCGGAGVLAILNPKSPDVLHQALYFRELLTTVGCSGQVRKLQLASQFEPLDDRLELDVGEMFAENAAARRADYFSRNHVCALEF